ncbi:VOC family protein [Solimonas sp. SE-A11]|nr:VOC family protein [Solimonas sp. SE-A11]MDM4772016.1 VOC family protein [Solimonas sp. SE-A11]
MNDIQAINPTPRFQSWDDQALQQLLSNTRSLRPCPEPIKLSEALEQVLAKLFQPLPDLSGAEPMNPRISMITLAVRDMAESVRFYEQGLGLPRMNSDPNVAFFRLNGSWLGLYGREALAEDVGIPAAGNGFSGFTLAHNLESEDAVDALMTQALEAGARLVKPAQKVFWGGYSGYFSDPDGHLWEVAHNPHFWIGPRDG